MPRAPRVTEERTYSAWDAGFTRLTLVMISSPLLGSAPRFSVTFDSLQFILYICNYAFAFHYTLGSLGSLLGLPHNHPGALHSIYVIMLRFS